VPSDAAPPDAPPRAAELHGLVDNAAPDRLYGWAWNAATPAERVTVELRLGPETVFRTVADFARPDLAKAGIGDGCHAFEIPLQPEWIRRRAELAVVARAADGAELPVPLRIRRAAVEAPEAGMQRAVEALVAGQRRLQEQIAVLGARLPEEGEREQLAALLATQEGVARQLETLTLWLTRLDERLAALPEATAPAARRGREGWTLVLGLVLGGIGAAALLAARWLAGG